MKIRKNKTLLLVLAIIMSFNNIVFASPENSEKNEGIAIEESDIKDEVGEVVVDDDEEVITEAPVTNDDIDFTGGTIEEDIIGGDFDYESTKDPIIFDYNYDDPILPTENKPIYNSEPFEFFRADNSSEKFSYSEYDIFEDEQVKEDEPGSNFIKTKKTLQYTKDIDGDYPIYVDTGILVDDENKISLDGYREFFNQMAVKEGGKVVEDEYMSMLLVNGRIILAKEGETSVDDLKDLFMESGIVIEAQSSRMGSRFDLVEKLERSKKLPIIIDNKEILQTAKPMIQDNKVLLPLRDVAEGLGAEVEWNKETGIATITKNEKTLTFKRNSDIIKVNGREFLISSPTNIRAGENRILSIIRVMVTEFDSEMFYDAHKQALVIETPELENIDLDW